MRCWSALLALGLGALASAACASHALASVQLELDAPAEVVLLQPIRLVVTATNHGDARVTVRDPVLDDRSFSFHVRVDDGRESRYTRFHPGAGMSSSIAGRYLEPGESMEFAHEVPALHAGTWSFRPVYAGVADQDAVEGPARAVRVKADGERTRALLRIATGAGTIEALFWTDVAPATCLHIALLARDGYYAGSTFHRVIQDFMIQGGAKDELGAGYSIPAEFHARPHVAGVLSMARRGDPFETAQREPDHKYKDSARTSFFICTGESSFLDARYTAFGAVHTGQDVLERIAAARVVENAFGELSEPEVPVEIQAVTLGLAP